MNFIVTFAACIYSQLSKIMSKTIDVQFWVPASLYLRQQDCEDQQLFLEA